MVFGCGAVPKDCPRGAATSAEMYAASEHGGRAAAASAPSTSSPHVWDQPYGGRTWFPWFYYWDPELEHARLTAAGIEDGEAREREYHAACNEIPEHAQARSALDTYALDESRLRDGVMLHLASDVGPPEVLLVALRCHRAWLRVVRRAKAGDNVLALDGVKVVVSAGARDGVDVLISSDAPAVVTEIERRARVAIARAQRLRATQLR